jgi:NADPH:quinone reductase-like Zn-dependent oxidoreductase
MIAPIMKAAVYRTYGPPEVVRIEDVEKPAPLDDEVLVRISASTLCTGDWRLRKPDPPPVGWFMNGFPRPKRIKILGMEFAGTVDSIGKNVTGLKVGDRVFGASWRFGAHAEYACFPERSIAKIPHNASFEEAAAIPYGGTSALYFLKRAGVKAGQKVLIYGASGSVGTASVQLAKYFGASVTGVCSTASVGLVKSLGAADVVDYTKDDFSNAGRIYDVIHDTVGKSGFWRSMHAIKRGGVYILPGPVWVGLEGALGAIWAKMTGSCKVIGGVAQGGVPALDFLAKLVETGEFRPVIDRCYPLASIAEAHRYAEAGHKKGNVVITIGGTH